MEENQDRLRGVTSFSIPAHDTHTKQRPRFYCIGKYRRNGSRVLGTSHAAVRGCEGPIRFWTSVMDQCDISFLAFILLYSDPQTQMKVSTTSVTYAMVTMSAASALQCDLDASARTDCGELASDQTTCEGEGSRVVSALGPRLHPLTCPEHPRMSLPTPPRAPNDPKTLL